MLIPKTDRTYIVCTKTQELAMSKPNHVLRYKNENISTEMKQ